MNILAEMVFGSNLYGTATKNSDQDFKGVFLPTKAECFLGKMSKSMHFDSNKNPNQKNTSTDVDKEYYSLQYFLQLCFQGGTCAIDMLHSPKTIITSPEWEFIRQNRSRFYTNSMKAFTCYILKQMSKYSVKGSRLNDAKVVLDYLKSKPQTSKIGEYWDDLPVGEHIEKIVIAECNTVERRAYSVCQRKLMFNTPMAVAIKTVQMFYDNYGHRAHQAANNLNIDWKAISHSYRACCQMLEIYTTGDLIYPLREAKLLTDIKLGKLHYVNDGVGEKLEELVDKIEKLAYTSKYPEKVDQNFWTYWLVNEVYK